MRTARGILVLAACLGVLAVVPARAEGFKELQDKVVEKVLPNGLRLILMPRPGAPVLSMVTYADVGGVDENQNATGLAHIFEHMAFKGTTTIGTTDADAEAAAMRREDEAFLALRAELGRRPRPDPETLKKLDAEFQAAQEAAKKFVVSNEFGQILEAAGSEGLNAFTSTDQTVYHYSLPSNKLELWAALESDRFSHPVLREFYREKDVIMEEKRMGESQPIGRLIDDFVAVAFKASMYRSFVIGHMSDLQAISRADARAWFDKYYRGRNLTMVVVGDLDPRTTLPMLEKHLGQIPPGVKPLPVVTVEPPQRAEKRIVMDDPSQPVLVMAYHKADINDPDDATFSALADIVAGGRSSRLYTSLVKEKKIALTVGALGTIWQKYPGLFLFFAMPNKGKSNAECETAINAEIERLKNEPVSAEELEGVKARAKSRFISNLNSNMGLAMGLAFAQNLRGDWHKMFTELDDIDKVTAADIQRVAKSTFVKSNRTVGTIENTPAEGGR